METKNSSCSANANHKAYNYDELFMHKSLLFLDNLKDLKDIRKQLYSAADYFELAYHKDDHKDVMVETLKDYVARAFISTVDHLGSVAFKVNNFLDERIEEVTRAELQSTCIEQRLRTCQTFIDKGGLSQQSLIITTPKYHKRYTFPAGETQTARTTGESKSIYWDCISCPEHNPNHLKTTVQEETMRQSQSQFRKMNSGLPSVQVSGNIGTFSFTRAASNREPGRRSVSLRRSGSTANVSIIRNSSNINQRFPSEPGRSLSMCIQPEIERERQRQRDNGKEIEQYAKKSKQFLKAMLMLSMHKSGKESLPKYYRCIGMDKQH